MLSDRLGLRDTPLRVAVVGCGAFGTMALSQLRRLQGLQVVGVVDLDPERARRALERAEWPDELVASTRLSDDPLEVIASAIDVLVEATGSPAAAARHALAAFEHGVSVVNVTVEADALLGPLLGEQAREAGVIYSYAYGDQPALICELVDWARSSGFPVISAGKGTKYLPIYHRSTPDTVWGHYGIDAAHARAEGLNAQMFNSFLDGTKSAIEMAAVANATGLTPQPGGLRFPPCAPEELSRVCIPEAAGGALGHEGTVEVVASLSRDGTELLRDLRWGVYVVIEAPGEYVRQRFAEYGVLTDPTGRYAALWRPYHFIGLEIGTSVLRAGLRAEATGCPAAFVADVASVAKRDLAVGEVLDGEGGHTVWGRLEPVGSYDALPIGLADGARVVRPVPAGAVVSRADVAVADPGLAALRERAERAMSPAPSGRLRP